MAQKTVLFLVNKDNVIYNFRRELAFKLLELGYRVVISCPYGKKLDFLTEKGAEWVDIKIDRRGTSVFNDLKLLKKYYPTGYYKAKDSLKNVQRPSISTRHDVIYNNIFGNSNPNKSSSYPQYGKVKNFVYDINIQDVNPNINKINYPMYNATANNNYDSYPSPEEYKKMMEKVGQKNYAYAGGEFIEGVPFRGQRPVFIKNGIKNNLRPLNDIGINNNEIRYRNKKLDEYGMNTIGIKKPSTGYYKTEGNYNMNNININKEKVEENKYYLNKVPEAI